MNSNWTPETFKKLHTCRWIEKQILRTPLSRGRSAYGASDFRVGFREVSFYVRLSMKSFSGEIAGVVILCLLTIIVNNWRLYAQCSFNFEISEVISLWAFNVSMTIRRLYNLIPRILCGEHLGRRLMWAGIHPNAVVEGGRECIKLFRLLARFHFLSSLFFKYNYLMLCLEPLSKLVFWVSLSPGSTQLSFKTKYINDLLTFYIRTLLVETKLILISGQTCHSQ